MEEFTKFAVEHFFESLGDDSPYFSLGNDGEATTRILEEIEERGKTRLTLTVSGESLWLINFDAHKKCSFFTEDKKYGLQKSSDHVVFRFKDGIWYLHIFEFKSSVSPKKWLEVKQKFRASYFTCKALAAVLGISFEDENVYAYTTFEKEVQPRESTNPAELRPLLGKRTVDPMLDWKEGKLLSLRIPQEGKDFRHTKIKMSKDEQGVLVGTFNI